MLLELLGGDGNVIGFLKLPIAGRPVVLKGLILAALGFTMPAHAAVIETSTMQNYIEWDLSGRYGGFDRKYGSMFGGAGDYAYSFFGQSPTQVAGLSFEVTTKLDSNGNFYFLHNAVCIGSCYLSIDTVVKFSLYNDSPDIVDLRYDSQITPGHLARQNFGSGPVEANFNFTLVDGTFTRPFAFQMTGEAAINNFIYPTTDPTYLVTYGDPNFALNSARAQNSGGPEVFNGGTAPNWNTLDWGATNIALNLKPLYGYESRDFYYVLSTFIRMESPCTDFSTCAGLQVAFGDPRNDGSSSQSSASRTGAASLAGLPSSYSPVVGAKFDAFKFDTELAPQSTPDLRPDPVVPPIVYSGVFVPPPGGVPEPASWLMLIAGFGLVGMRLRHQKAATA